MRSDLHPVIVFERPRGLASINLRELWQYRGLFFFLVRRHVLVRYAQTALGVLWVVLQPGLLTLLFAFVFGHLVRVPTGGVPYWTIALTGIMSWSFFAGAVSAGADSLRINRVLVTNVYCPRLLIILVPAVAGLVDFAVALGITLLLLSIGGIYPSALAVPLVPLLALQLALTGAGLAYWLAALSAKYRDAHHLVPFLLQVGLYASPVIYPASLVPLEYRAVYWLNPIAVIIESVRSLLLHLPPPPTQMLLTSLFVSFALVLSGAAFFKQQEPEICDVV